jgi:hypothetical protein
MITRNLAGAGLRPFGAPSLLPRERGYDPAVLHLS